MVPPFRLHLALLGQVNSLSCRDAGWRQGGASHSLWVHGERSLQAKGLCRCQGARASTPSGQQKSLGLLGGFLPAWLRAWGWQKSQPGWEILGRGGGCCFTLSRQSSSLQPPARHQRSVTRTAAGTATNHESLCRCARPSLCKTEEAG